MSEAASARTDRFTRFFTAQVFRGGGLKPDLRSLLQHLSQLRFRGARRRLVERLARRFGASRRQARNLAHRIP